MSNYQSKALNPRNHLLEQVSMLDDFYGKHKFAVAFQDGSKYPDNQVVCIHPNDLDAEDVRVFYQRYVATIKRSRHKGFYGFLYVNNKAQHFDGRTLDAACVEFKNTVDDMRRNK